MQKNTPKLWDDLRQKTVVQEEKYNLIREKNSIR